MSIPGDIADVLIIGAGPVGLHAAFCAGVRQMSVKLVDSLPMPGGQLVTLYPDKLIYDVGGFLSIRASELADKLIDQARFYSPAECMGETVRLIENDGNAIHVVADKAVHRCRTVLIAGGVGALKARPPNPALISNGYTSSLGPINDWHLELKGGTIKVDHTMRTSRANIFAAGDIASYPGKLKLISTGFGEAATAINHIANLLDPTKPIFPGHSSNLQR